MGEVGEPEDAVDQGDAESPESKLASVGKARYDDEIRQEDDSVHDIHFNEPLRGGTEPGPDASPRTFPVQANFRGAQAFASLTAKERFPDIRILEQ